MGRYGPGVTYTVPRRACALARATPRPTDGDGDRPRGHGRTPVECCAHCASSKGRQRHATRVESADRGAPAGGRVALRPSFTPLGRKVRPGLLMEHVQALCDELRQMILDSRVPRERRRLYANAGAAIAATYSPGFYAYVIFSQTIFSKYLHKNVLISGSISGIWGGFRNVYL